MTLQVSETSPAPAKILLVDDRPEHLLALQAILERPDYELVTATSGEEALRCILSDYNFAVILLDVAMPKLDGFETAALIRQRPKARSIPIIFVSGVMYDMVNVYRGYSAGAVDYLPKPLDPLALRAKVGVFVELFRQTRSAQRQSEARRAAEQRERELAEALYQLTFDEAPVGIGHATVDGRWLRVNRRLADIAGYAPEALPMTKLVDLFDPEDRARFDAVVVRIVTAGGAKHRGEYRIIRPDGSRVWIALTVSLLLDHEGRPVQLTIMEDLSEQKMIVEARLARLRDSGFLGIAFQDPDGTITDANVAFLDMIGYSREDLRARRVSTRSLTSPEQGDVAVRALEELRSTGVCRPYEWEITRKDGRRAAVLVGATVLDGLESGVVSFALDVTERRQREQERARMLGELRASVRARDEFISIAAHELKNPLTPILMMVTSLRAHCRESAEPVMPPWLERRLNPVERAVRRIQSLVDTLLDVSRLTVGPLHLDLAEVDLCALMREIVARSQPAIEDAGCAVTLRADAPVIGRWDRNRLDQAATNVLMNALKYGAGKPIEIDVERQGEHGWMSIRDHGIGIADEDQKRIFERFERLEPVRHFGGFGLGLWIAHVIVDAHGGTIGIWSKPAEGSRFTIELPGALDVAGGEGEPQLRPAA